VNAVGSDNQNAARPGVPSASCLDCAVPIKHDLTHELHVNIFVMSVFDDVACDKNAVQELKAQFNMHGVLPKCVNASVAD
jgi:hypothetical protein